MDEEDKFQEDDDFFDVEARGRCYTWPVNQNTVNVGIVPTPRRGSNSSTCTPLSDSYYTLVSTSGSKYLSSDNSLSGHTSTGYEQNFLLSHDPGQFLTRCRQQPSPSYNPCLTVPSISSLSNFPSNIRSNSTLNEPSNNSSVSSSVDQLFQNKSYLDDNERESQNNSPILDYSEKPKRVRRRNIGDPTTHKKPNPWGDDSYSDLIARAISSSDTERLKLNEIYQWFIDNIPYFGEKSSQEDAQGWKNSIRHNLSLHSRFMRIQNEGAGKSSWWVINPDAKPGRNPRRRANTMENAVKSIDKKRRGVGSSSSRKSSLHGPFTSNETCAMDSGESLGLDSGIGGNSNFEVYRPRTQSALSIPGTSSRISPTQEPPGFEDFDFSNWMDRSQPQKCPSNSTNVKELLDRTDQMRIDAIPADIKLTSRIKAEPSSPQEFGQKIPLTNGGITLRTLKAECLDSNYAIAAASIKMENSGLQPPPSYQELTSSDFCNVQVQPNQINQLIQSQQNTNGNLSKLVTSSGQFYTPASTAYNDNISLASMQPLTAHSHSMIPGLLPAQWMINQAPNQEYQSLRQQINPNIPHQNQINQQSGFHRIDGLPQDLENLVSLDQPLAITLQSMDMEAVLRHELSHSHGNQLQFDLP